MNDGKQCMGASCGGLKTQATTAGNACKVPTRVKEDIGDQCKSSLWNNATISYANE